MQLPLLLFGTGLTMDAVNTLSPMQGSLWTAQALNSEGFFAQVVVAVFFLMLGADAFLLIRNTVRYLRGAKKKQSRVLRANLHAA